MVYLKTFRDRPWAQTSTAVQLRPAGALPSWLRHARLLHGAHMLAQSCNDSCRVCRFGLKPSGHMGLLMSCVLLLPVQPSTPCRSRSVTAPACVHCARGVPASTALPGRNAANIPIHDVLGNIVLAAQQLIKLCWVKMPYIYIYMRKEAAVCNRCWVHVLLRL